MEENEEPAADARAAEGSSPTGLSAAEAQRRLAEHGRNELERGRGRPAWRLLVDQFLSPVIGLLTAACVIAAVLGEVADAIAIAAIVVLIGLIGFFQEYRAERALLALRTLTAPRARVLRDGHLALVPAAEVVPGDILSFEAGDIVAADARVLEAHDLTTNEAPLTGESQPVRKQAEPVAADAPLAERFDRVFMGTAVVDGAGLAEVVATGMATEFGKIAALLAEASEGDDETPLERRLAQVSRVLILICLGIVAVIAAIGLLRGDPWLDVLMMAVSLAVAAVPEGLPAVVTIALAIGVQRMAKRRVLIRRLKAVETLGCVTVICTDKTGTLTAGVMQVRELWGADQARLLDAAAACCDADYDAEKDEGVGDPTEVAILRAAAARGIRRPELEEARPRLRERPFDADRKRMSIARADGRLYVKGAVESLLPLAVGADVAAIERANDDLASRGLRVLAVAVRDLRPDERSDDPEAEPPAEADLELLGLIGLADPPRPEVIDAIARAHAAGIETVMITGDHPRTAHAIARELGLLERPLAGVHTDDAASADSDADADAEENKKKAPPLVHARATPAEKIAIIREWRDRGAIVAMTGDGINDAPALREAHVGIAMGETGTEVTREAGDVVLTEDNFADILEGVREGRGVFANIRKSLVYLLAGNTGELGVMLSASLLGLPIPFLPLQILWINLATDGLPALALVMDPTDPAVMDAPPRDPAEPILGRREWRQIALIGLLDGGLVVAAFAWALGHRDLESARAFAFCVLVLGELFRALAARSRTRTFWEVGVLSNRRLIAVIVASLIVQLGLLHWPVSASFFGFGHLSSADTLIALGLALVPVSVLEILKLVARRLRPPADAGGSEPR
ncbi:MAG: cation-translocating P-type ATPase [Myxococcales bacterium]|nr:cation-translocating P-type ATPase [Myxococcales bacterium]